MLKVGDKVDYEYNKTIWVNKKTRVGADNLNNMEDGIQKAHLKADELSKQISEINSDKEILNKKVEQVDGELNDVQDTVSTIQATIGTSEVSNGESILSKISKAEQGITSLDNRTGVNETNIETLKQEDSSIKESVAEVMKDMQGHKIDVSAHEDIRKQIGDTSSLMTNTKEIVGAINELYTSGGSSNPFKRAKVVGSDNVLRLTATTETNVIDAGIPLVPSKVEVYLMGLRIFYEKDFTVNGNLINLKSTLRPGEYIDIPLMDEVVVDLTNKTMVESHYRYTAEQLATSFVLECDIKYGFLDVYQMGNRIYEGFGYTLDRTTKTITLVKSLEIGEYVDYSIRNNLGTDMTWIQDSVDAINKKLPIGTIATTEITDDLSDQINDCFNKTPITLTADNDLIDISQGHYIFEGVIPSGKNYPPSLVGDFYHVTIFVTGISYGDSGHKIIELKTSSNTTFKKVQSWDVWQDWKQIVTTEITNELTEQINNLLKKVEEVSIPNKVYGVEIDYVNSTITRVRDSVGLTQASFDDISPWKDMKRVTFDDGNVMVEIPNFYCKREIISSEVNPNGENGVQVLKERRLISTTPQHGFTPIFNYADGVKNKVYLSAYEGSLSDDGTKLLSLPNKTIAHTKTRDQFRKLARANGNGYEIQDFIVSTAIQWLITIEYASTDCQSMIGQGNVNNTVALQTGLTSSLGNKSGNASGGTNGLTSVSYRGIENFWGNVWKFVDGINIEGYGKNIFWYTNDRSKYLDNTKEGFINGGNVSKTNGYVDRVSYTDEENLGFLPTRCSGASNKVLNDYYWQNNAHGGFLVARLGAGWNDGLGAGCFYWTLDISASTAGSTIGSRLLCIK